MASHTMAALLQWTSKALKAAARSHGLSTSGTKKVVAQRILTAAQGPQHKCFLCDGPIEAVTDVCPRCEYVSMEEQCLEGDSSEEPLLRARQGRGVANQVPAGSSLCLSLSLSIAFPKNIYIIIPLPLRAGTTPSQTPSSTPNNTFLTSRLLRNTLCLGLLRSRFAIR